eukprot:m.128483 g.128483  ORF g.128483 m.128483 type:complete len:59 (-) comp15671_c0_seq1:1504-1680(-)
MSSGDYDYDKELLDAAARGDLPAATSALGRGADVNCKDKKSSSWRWPRSIGLYILSPL